MKWAYSIQQKFKAAVLLAIIFVIILLTNFWNRHQMKELSTAFSAVYEDRLVAERYIFLMSDQLYQKKLAINNCTALTEAEYQTKIGFHNDSIARLLTFYENTVLTEDEAIRLGDFKTNVAALQALESQYSQSFAEAEKRTATRILFDERFALASANLHQLSNIQIKEGKVLNEQSQRIAYNSFMLTNLEMVILFGIAFALQAIIIASQPLISRKWGDSNLN